MLEAGSLALMAPLVITVASLALMMQIAFWRHALGSWVITCLTLVVALAVLPLMAKQVPLQITPLLLADQFSLFFTALILFATLITTLLAKDYLEHRSGENEEFYLLLLLSALGAILLASATHLASFLLGLELLGVALYALIAYPERGKLPLEAAIKYLVLSGAASAVLLFGFALIYAALGTLSFSGIGEQLAQASLTADRQALVLIGTAMVLPASVLSSLWCPFIFGPQTCIKVRLRR